VLIQNIGRLVTMEPGHGREGALGVIADAAVLSDGETITWCGPTAELPAESRSGETTAIDAQGGVVMPGLVDCHTHLVHAGSREREFVARARGESYQAIAASGGGILSTVRATREASEDALLEGAQRRALEALRFGTTTIEIKSGYGLDWPTEQKMLRVAKQLTTQVPIRTVRTFLGAHVVPPEFSDRRGAYVEALCTEMIPAVVREALATACDIFVEEGAFSAEDARTIAAAARAQGLAMRLHVDQFHDGDGGVLAAALQAASADHLDCLSAQGVAAMAKAGVVAGLLPAASFFTRCPQRPPVEQLVAAQVPIAIATDYNPGTAPTLDLMLCGTIAITQWGLDPDLALLGMTRIAARALGCESHLGSIGPSKAADLLVLQCKDEYYPLYRFGTPHIRTVIRAGEVVFGE
jgi:imidazolonepropionase